MGGKARAADDARDMFPAAVEVIRALRPKSFLIENVKGLTRSTFANYYQLILLRLQLLGRRERTTTDRTIRTRGGRHHSIIGREDRDWGTQTHQNR